MQRKMPASHPRHAPPDTVPGCLPGPERVWVYPRPEFPRPYPGFEPARSVIPGSDWARPVWF